MSILKVFQIVGAISAWMEKSIIDGVIDQTEMVDLIKLILEISGVKAEIKVS